METDCRGQFANWPRNDEEKPVIPSEARESVTPDKKTDCL